MSKQVENIVETIDFRMVQLANKELTLEERGPINDYNQIDNKQLFTSSTGKIFNKESYEDQTSYEADLAGYRQIMIDSMPEWLSKQCADFGVEAPSDSVGVTLELGGVLFELFMANNPVPQAPLAQALYKKKSMEYAEALTQSVFVVPKEVMDTASGVLQDDKKWASCVVTAKVNTGSETQKMMTLNGSGLLQFRKVMAGLIMLFLPEETTKAKVNNIKSVGA